MSIEAVAEAVSKNLEATTLVVAAIGTVIVALAGVYRASSGALKPGTPNSTGISSEMLVLIDQHITRMKGIEEQAQESVRVMNETRRLLENMSGYDNRSVGQLEAIARTMDRVESNQNKTHNTLHMIKNHEEAVVEILGQIREFMKMIHAQHNRR